MAPPHELSHELRNDDCLFPANGKQPICFKLDAGLPKRSLGKINSFQARNPDQQIFLQTIQKIYLTDLDQPPTWLFDELNAYTITAIGITENLKSGKRNRFFNEIGKRNAIVLPMFMVITANYLKRLQSIDPIAFRRNFVADKLNASSLRSVLSFAEDTYKDWEIARDQSKVKPIDFESNLIREYRRGKKALQKLLSEPSALGILD